MELRDASTVFALAPERSEFRMRRVDGAGERVARNSLATEREVEGFLHGRAPYTKTAAKLAAWQA
jgi:hypothetical protein